MRLHSVTSTIENGFVYLPERAEWLASYLHELTTFPSGKLTSRERKAIATKASKAAAAARTKKAKARKRVRESEE